MSYLALFLQWKNDDEIRNRLFCTDNAAQKSNDGLFLEDIASVCICVASRVDGVSGTPVSTFLQQLRFYLFGINNDFAKFFNTGAYFSFLSGDFIPFLSVQNQKWLSFMRSLPNCRFGHLEIRTQNQTQVDIKCVPFSFGHDMISLSKECKDWENKIDISTLENKLIPSIPATSKLHILFTRYLQKHYYSSRRKKGPQSYEQAFQNNDRAKGYIFFKLDHLPKQNELRLDTMKGLPSKVQNPSCLVYFSCIVQLNL
jgi:hypothetical protein